MAKADQRCCAEYCDLARLRRSTAHWRKSEFVAHRLLLDDLRCNQRAIELLCPRVPNPRRLVSLVLPTAIPAESAARLLQGIRRKTASRLVALPVRSADLALLYVQRAACRQPGFDLVEALDSTEAQAS